MITINDVSVKALARLQRLLGTNNFTALPEENGVIPKVSLSVNVCIAFSPKHGYVILESELGQAELELNEFSSLTIL